MKKLSALLLAVILVLSLAACASTAKNDEPAPDASEAAKLTMATEATFPPYEYYDGDAIVGIDVEVAQAIANKLGMELEVTDIAFPGNATDSSGNLSAGPARLSSGAPFRDST